MLEPKLYNMTLDFPVPDAVITHIAARQATATTRSDAQPSPFLGLITEEWVTKLDKGATSDIELHLKPVRSKIRGKWWGPQGRALQVDPTDLLIPYHTARSVGNLRSYITKSGYVLLREWFSPMKEFIAERYHQHSLCGNPSIYRRSSEVYNRIMSKPKSSTGFRGFSTVESRNPDWVKAMYPFIGESRLDPNCTLLDPILQWYRDMRQKFRAIFASSLSHMFLYERGLSVLLTEAMKASTSVFYHSELDESYYATKWIRSTAKQGCTVVECDQEMMDAHCSESLCIQSLEIAAEMMGVSLADTDRLLSDLSLFFNIPVWGIDNMIHIRHWNLLSGIGPTNGIENVINVLVHMIAIGRVIDQHPLLGVKFLLRVMGDDSALLIANSETTDLFTQLFLEEFEFICGELGLVIQRAKQGVSKGIYCFCRRYYPCADGMRGFKMIEVHGTQIPYPIYPIDYAINSLLRPEDAAYDERQSHAFKDISVSEVHRLCALMDNSWGDPRTKSFINHLLSICNPEAVVDDLLLDSRLKDTWRTKVYGAPGWRASSSPTANYLFSKVAKNK